MLWLNLLNSKKFILTTHWVYSYDAGDGAVDNNNDGDDDDDDDYEYKYEYDDT